MPVGSPRSWRLFVCAFAGAAILAACTVGNTTTPKRKKRSPVDPGDDFYSDVPSAIEPIEPDEVNDNSGAFGAGERPAEASSPAGRPDAGPTMNPDAGGPTPKTFCGTTVEAGDLAVVEIMITSKAGSSDTGEWVEVQSTRNCWLKLQGVTVTSPRGAAAVNTATITDEFELPPNGTFVVADSVDPAKNHGIGGKVIAWEATDVLKNDGDTITVTLGNVEIDRLAYPSFNNLTPGRTLAFPIDCAWSQRSDWARWSLTFTEFAPGFKGTPNADNVDVACY